MAALTLATGSDGSVGRDAEEPRHDAKCTRGQVAVVGDQTGYEVLESRVSRLERDHARDREEMSALLRAGFADVKADIGALNFVHPDVFKAWQETINGRFNQIDSEIIWNRRLTIGSVGGAIMAFMAWAFTGVNVL